MKIIRDEEFGGIMMIPLFCDWGIRRCNVEGCRERPTTIITQLPDGLSPCGFYEKHFQEGNVPGGTKFTLEFDDYDAFKPQSQEVEVLGPGERLPS